MLVSGVQSLSFPPSLTYPDQVTPPIRLDLPSQPEEGQAKPHVQHHKFQALLLNLLLKEAVLARYQVCPTLTAYLVRRNVETGWQKEGVALLLFLLLFWFLLFLLFVILLFPPPVLFPKYLLCH